jgi:hypothetical protein
MFFQLTQIYTYKIICEIHFILHFEPFRDLN